MLKDFDAFDTAYEFYKGNLHSHTTNSDGKLSPKEMADIYKDAGYSFLAITDHNLFSDYSAEFDTNSFKIIPGAEATVLWLYKKDYYLARKCHHLLVFKDPYKESFGFGHLEPIDILKLYDKDVDFVAESQKFIDYLKQKNAVLCYNHPVWSRVNDTDFLSLKGLDFVEIYNWGTELDSSAGFDVDAWQKFLEEDVNITALATDDNHNHEEGELFDSLGGFVMVNAPKLEQGEIMKSLLKGSYYSSSGALINNWGIRDGRAYIDAVDAKYIFMTVGPGVRSSQVRLTDHAVFDIPDEVKYFRFELIDKKGKRAWTNPYWVKDAFTLE